MNNPTPIPVTHGGGAPVHQVFNPFGSLHREIDRLFEDFTATVSTGRNVSEIKAKMDLAETGDGLELTVELPGLEEKDVDVAVSGNLLTVSGNKKFESEKKGRNYRVVERSYGSFSRSITLPDGVKADQVKASLSKGVLRVSIPTPPPANSKKIEVKTTT
jgi:HSP20 family protein